MARTLPILSFDTSDRTMGVDVSIDGQSLCCKVINEPRVHASLLVPTILETLEESGWTLNDLCSIAVAKGPGSYTGLRIGVSTAKGLAYTLGIPLIGIPTMQALAVAYRKVDSGKTLVTVLSSRKNELYAQVWDIADSIRPLTELASVSFSEVPSYLRGSGRHAFLSIGGGSQELVSAVSSIDDLSVASTPEELNGSTVHGLAAIAFERFERSLFDDVAGFEPFYLKDFVAKKGASPFDGVRNR